MKNNNNKTVHFSECPRDKEHWFDQYLSNKLSSGEMDAFEQHYFNCDSCFKELNLRRQVKGFFQEEASSMFPEYIENLRQKQKNSIDLTAENSSPGKKRINRKWFYTAAAIFALFFLLTIPSELNDQNPINNINSVPPIESHQENYAANFKPSPYLEGRVNDRYRNSYNISVSSPANSEKVKGVIHFNWKIDKNGKGYKEALTLIILNNLEENLFDFQVSESQFTFEEPLSPGLYYWLLETNNETIYVGKFIVDN